MCTWLHPLPGVWWRHRVTYKMKNNNYFFLFNSFNYVDFYYHVSLFQWNSCVHYPKNIIPHKRLNVHFDLIVVFFFFTLNLVNNFYVDPILFCACQLRGSVFPLFNLLFLVFVV